MRMLCQNENMVNKTNKTQEKSVQLAAALQFVFQKGLRLPGASDKSKDVET